MGAKHQCRSCLVRYVLGNYVVTDASVLDSMVRQPLADMTAYRILLK